MGSRIAGTFAIRLVVELLGGGRFLATSPDVPGLVADGLLVTGATAIAQDLASKIAESCHDHGDPLPLAMKPRSRPVKRLELVVPASS